MTLVWTCPCQGKRVSPSLAMRRSPPTPHLVCLLGSSSVTTAHNTDLETTHSLPLHQKGLTLVPENVLPSVCPPSKTLVLTELTTRSALATDFTDHLCYEQKIKKKKGLMIRPTPCFINCYFCDLGSSQNIPNLYFFLVTRMQHTQSSLYYV